MKFTKFFAANLTLALVALALSISAIAQTTVAGKFHLDEEVRWGAATLPAGDYTLSLDRTQSPYQAFVRSTDGKLTIITPIGSTNDAVSDQSFLKVDGVSGNRRIDGFNIAPLEIYLSYQPMTKLEREQLAKLKGKTVTVSMGQ